MAGFIDLSALALISGYQMSARGMTLMGVQVLYVLALLIINRVTGRVISQNCYKCMGWATSSLVP